MAATYKDDIKPSVYMFPIIQLLIDVVLNANTRSGDGFLPVNLIHVIEGFAAPSRPHTISLIIVPTSRSMFRSNTPISLVMLIFIFSREETGPDLLQCIHVVGVYQLCQRVTDHSSMKGKLCDRNQSSVRSGSYYGPYLHDPLPVLDLCPPGFQHLEYPGGVLDPRQMSLDVMRRRYIIKVDETRHRCMTSRNDGQRKRRSEEPFAEKIAPQGGPSAVQDPYIGVIQLRPRREVSTDHRSRGLP